MTICDILADITFRLARCAGDTQLSPEYRGDWVMNWVHYDYMWKVLPVDTQLGWKEMRRELRVPAWMERRKPTDR